MTDSMHIPPNDSQCGRCGGQGHITSLCRAELKPFLVAVERTSVYRVMARDADDAVTVYMDTDPKEVDVTTNSMSAEPDEEES